MSSWLDTPTGISGFNAIAHGELPKGGSSDFTGTPSSVIGDEKAHLDDMFDA